MKIWYQTISVSRNLPVYNKVLHDHVNSVAPVGVTVTVKGTGAGGLADEYKMFQLIDGVDVLQNALRAKQEGIDAFVIGNMVDSAMWECREALDIPVIGLSETAMHYACTLGRKFAIIPINRKFIPSIEDNVRRYGLIGRLAGFECMDYQIPDLDGAFATEEGARSCIEEFHLAARRAIARDAEVLIPGSGVTQTLLGHHGISRVDGVPVIDSTRLSVLMAQLAVTMKQVAGLSISRHLMYEAPSQRILEAARKTYRLEGL